MKNSIKTLLALSTVATYALPIDWHGEFQVDTHRIEEFSKIKDKTTGTIADGSQETELADGSKSNASFQTYVLKLNPEVIINDSTSFKAQLTTGYGYGNRLGNETANKKESSTTQNRKFTNALYPQDTVTESSLNVTQAYAVFYADTATYKVGRISSHWGLGALHNDGTQMGTRFATIRDGITIDFKIGNFNITPYYAKINSKGSLTKAARIKETGVKFLYDNLDTDFSFGLLYGINKASNFAEIESEYTSQKLGLTDVKITDVYMKKSVGNYSFEAEIPLLSGDLGHLYSSDKTARYNAKAFLVNNTYKLSQAHTFKLNVGKVSGDNGSESSYGAMYLHPNFQVANLLFKYNMSAIKDTEQNVFDSYISNTMFLKVSHTYFSNNWSWENAIVWAKAEEVAKNGSRSYNHTNNKYFTAAADQSTDLGFEIDSNITYKWNTSVTLQGNFGYLFTGDYFAFTNTATENEVKNAYVLNAAVNVSF